MSKPCFGTHLFLKLVAALLLRSLDKRFKLDKLGAVLMEITAGKEHPWEKKW
jgi:hypothetical protein